MENLYKETLEKQLKLLSERSMKSNDNGEIVALTEQMVNLVAVLEGNQFSAGRHVPCAVQLSGTDLTDLLCGQEARRNRHNQCH